MREQSRSLANRMGAEVDEMDLGQTEDKTRLVHGSPSKIRATASHLNDFTKAFNNIGKGLKGLDSSSLKGKAADAFRETVSIEPPKWHKAADACEKAAEALEGFASTVEWAQREAQTAIDKWKDGTKASKEALDAHKAKVDAYNSAVDKYNAQPAEKRDPSSLPPKPGTFTDPGKKLMEEAQEILAEARKQRNTAAETARKAVRAARDTAPAKPSYAQQALGGLQEIQVMQNHVGGGILKGTADLLTFARGVNPLDPYNLTHPAEYALNLNNTAAGLVQVANDPWGAGRQMVADFMKDPAEGFGRLLPDAALTAATGGAGAGVKGVRAATKAADLAVDANRARKLLDDNPKGTHSRNGSERTSTGTDPVDLASGRMFLPQTDLSLPGILPLEFTRRVESGYTAGRWFGPSWSSTVDERLEIDPVGVVHVTADGLLLTYPHPAPGLPVLPETGTALRPLEREESGGYVLTDPDTGLVRHFAAPAGAEDGGDGTAWLVRIGDRDGNTVAIDRAGDGTPLALEHSAGHHLALTVDEGRVTALRLAGADGTQRVVMRYGYTGGDLTAVTKPSGATLAFAYDDRHRVVAWVDSNGRRYDYVYDEQHRVVAEGGEGGHFQLTLAYTEPDPETGHRTTTLTTADGRATRHLVGEGCRILATTDPLGHTTRFTYDTRGNLLSRTDPLGRTTGFSYDAHGRLTGVVRPDGREIAVTRDGLGLPTEIREADGTVWRHAYDERGNRTAATDPAGHTTRYTYDEYGRLTAVTNALGETTRVRCDAAGLPVEITDPLGAVTRYERDAFGRPTAVTDPLGAVTRLEWTADGHLARRTGPDGAEERWEYDGEGNCVRHTDAAGGTTAYEYTHFDLLVARTDPDGARYTFAHDAELRLTRVTNPRGMTWQYAYDPAGRLISETDFDDRTLTYAYDPAGQLTARTTPSPASGGESPVGATITFAYDELGRIVRKEADGALTEYEHDPAGRPVRITGPDAEVRWQRDRLGRIKTEMVNGRVLTFSYDALGRRTRRTTPTGATTTYAYDTAGNRTTLTTCGHTLDFAHDAAGRETSRRIGDALTLDQVWDPAGRLTGQTLTGPDATTPVQHRTYHYRPDGYLTGVDDLLAGSRTFDLDAVGRVTAVTAAGWTESYAYDAAGNQTAAHWPTTHAAAEAVGERTYTGTRLTRAGNIRYEHDGAGRLVLRQKTRLSKKPDTWRYEWDAEDRLTSVVTPDGTRWRYRYDPLGRRIAKQRLTDTGEVAEQVNFTWDDYVLIEQTTTAEDLPHPVTLTWDHHGFQPLTQTERLTDAATQAEIDARFFAIVTDLVGTPTELVDDTGAIAWRTRTTLWGTTTWAATSTAYTPLRFPGQYHDPETGLHYNCFRHYDPATGRYATPDPLGLAPAPNPATYPHNPHTWTDPLGLAPEYPKGSRTDSLRKIALDQNGNPLGVEDSKGVQMVSPQQIEDISASIRQNLGAPDSVKNIPGKGTVEVWHLEDGNVNYRNFSSSGGKGDITIDFTGDLKGKLGFKRFHATHDEGVE